MSTRMNSSRHEEKNTTHTERERERENVKCLTFSAKECSKLKILFKGGFFPRSLTTPIVEVAKSVNRKMMLLCSFSLVFV